MKTAIEIKADITEIGLNYKIDPVGVCQKIDKYLIDGGWSVEESHDNNRHMIWGNDDYPESIQISYYPERNELSCSIRHIDE